MNKSCFLFILMWLFYSSVNGQVAISNAGGIPHSSAQLDVLSINKGVLIPRMNSSARNNISVPANGLLVYDTDTKSQWFYSAQFTRWLQIIDSTKDMWALNTDVIYNRTTASVGIGTNTPASTVNIHNQFTPSVRFTNTATGNGSTNGTEMLLTVDEFIVKNNEITSTNFITDGSNRMIMNNTTGNIAIGNIVPSSPLSFPNITGEKINLSNVSATAAYGVGVAPATLQIHAATSADEIQFGIGKSGAGFTKLLSVDVPFSNLHLTNKMTRTSRTAGFNLLPVAYGRVNANGTLANSGTVNYTIIKNVGGVYQLRLNDPDFVSQPFLFTIIISPYNYVPANTNGATCCSESTVYHNIDYSGTDIYIRLYEYLVLTAPVFCSNCIGSLESTFFNNYVPTDSGFSFWVYKAS